MTGTFSDPVTITWHIAPLSPPQPHRHCPTCGTSRPYRCSGKIRLNANGRRLDAWLIYRCSACDRTWNLPLLDRVPVAAIDPGDLWAMQISDPSWVKARAFDLALLRRHADRNEQPADLMVTKSGSCAANWTGIILDLHALLPTGQRLDRFLAAELGLSRSRLQTLERSGAITFAPGAHRPLRMLVAGHLQLRLVAARLDASEIATLSRAVLGPSPGPSAES